MSNLSIAIKWDNCSSIYNLLIYIAHQIAVTFTGIVHNYS